VPQRTLTLSEAVVDVLDATACGQEYYAELSLMKDHLKKDEWEIILLRDYCLYEWNDIAFYFDISPRSAMYRYQQALARCT